MESSWGQCQCLTKQHRKQKQEDQGGAPSQRLAELLQQGLHGLGWWEI